MLFYAAPVWGSAANTNIQKIQILQNKLLRSFCEFPWYVCSQTINNTLNVESIKKVIQYLSENLYNNIPTIPNPEIFNLPDYDIRQFHKLPKSSVFIPTRIHYKQSLFQQSYS